MGKGGGGTASSERAFFPPRAPPLPPSSVSRSPPAPPSESPAVSPPARVVSDDGAAAAAAAARDYAGGAAEEEEPSSPPSSSSRSFARGRSSVPDGTPDDTGGAAEAAAGGPSLPSSPSPSPSRPSPAAGRSKKRRRSDSDDDDVGGGSAGTRVVSGDSYADAIASSVVERGTTVNDKEEEDAKEEEESEAEGYVLLEDTTVLLTGGAAATIDDDDDNAIVDRGWFDVDLISDGLDFDDSGGVGASEAEAEAPESFAMTEREDADRGGVVGERGDGDGGGGGCDCPRCAVVLRRRRRDPPSSSDAGFSLNVDSLPRFDGTVADARCRRPRRAATTKGGSGSKPGDVHRSDASLLLGLVRSCLDGGWAIRASVRAAFPSRGGVGSEEGGPSNDGGGGGEANAEAERSTTAGDDDDEPPRRRRRGVSLLVTVSFRARDGNGVCGAERDGRTPAPPRRRRQRRSGGGGADYLLVPPCAQLLLSLLRSDLDGLDRKPERASTRRRRSVDEDDARSEGGGDGHRPPTMGGQQTDGRGLDDDEEGSRGGNGRGRNDRAAAVGLFPPEMSLEELYRRIHGARQRRRHRPVSFANPNRTLSVADCASASDPSLLVATPLPPPPSFSPRPGTTTTTVVVSDDATSLLPDDLLRDRIAPYLRAASLDALRSCSRRLRDVLSTVVPGLKLRLFRHQSYGLDWMRRRESGTTTATAWGETEEEEAATLGTVSLRSTTRRGTATATATTSDRDEEAPPPPAIVRLDGRTGRVVPTIASSSSERRRRRRCGKDGASNLAAAPRGGLLCDDPGLGKTITVLGLILQTFGLTGERRRQRRRSRRSSSTTSEDAGRGKDVRGAASDDAGASDDDASDVVDDDEEVFRAYWSETLSPEARTHPLVRLVNRLRKSDDESGYFDRPVDPTTDECPDYYDVVDRPISMRDVLDRIRFHSYGNNLEGLCGDVDLCFRNAMLYNPPGHRVHEAAKRLSVKFRSIVREFKSDQAKRARRSYARCGSARFRRKRSFGRDDGDDDDGDGGSSVASLLARRARRELIRSLHPSMGTLLIVPNNLLKHWEDQIMTHVDFSYCTRKIPLVFRHGKRSAGASPSPSVDDAIRLCSIEKTHFPLLFVDAGTASNPLPPPAFLSTFRIVITTFQRITSEWKFGSVEREIRSRDDDDDGGGSSRTRRFDEAFDEAADDSDATQSASSLLKVHWLRLVVDEGHAMGRGTPTNAMRFASWIAARRRWAMTGTPSRQTSSRDGLRNVLGLLRFLEDGSDPSRRGGGRISDRDWQDLVARPWNAGRLAPFFRLRNLLSVVMVRHSKSDIEEIPPPVRIRTIVDMGRRERTSYNALVSAAQMNVKTTSMEGKTSGWQDSLLNPRQSRHAMLALGNIRLACCGGTYVLPQLSDKHWTETLQYLRHKHGCDEIKVTVVENFLRRATTGGLSSCMSCGLQLQTLFIVPCGDLVCTECFDGRSRQCPACGDGYDVDDFQRLQPGFVFEWKLNLNEEKEMREREAAMRRELAEARGGGEGAADAFFAGDDDDDDDDPSLGRDLRVDLVADGGGDVDPNLRHAAAASDGTRRHRKKRDHRCSYSRTVGDGKCLVCREEHFDCDFVTDDSRCSVCHKVAEECPPDSSKAFYVTQKLWRLRRAERDGVCVAAASGAASRFLGEEVRPKLRRPLKVIVFSQFRQLLDYVGDRLIRRFGGACVAEYWGKTKGIELEKFSKSRNCFCMLLGKEGSHGLDLSFVTNIVLLDELWDRSLENQVVARAYRMGATGRVEVEQLVARHSVEELMSKMNQRTSSDDYRESDDDPPRGPTVGSDVTAGKDGAVTLSGRSNEEKQAQQAKLHHLLKNVSLVREGTKTNAAAHAKKRKGMHAHAENEESVVSGDRKRGGRVRFAVP